ncbi:exopolyphosphatase / guanosine-5'-triphosphate,3'-diphosphate pyrophosphatase [Kytococcus aerolatus]|uniref:Exopolyphosphatase / guanosine-5'-triphosphate,3'-diphosphate pyrophosphatase n=1 Tax=Kytococcus aerolatus TaxID=592308 RepID=A0A212U8F6_9MICO|nr:exopolyphosphatase [Kytococcus aerolatus]SNC74324.1 exopolyphosphatase / guanosine-5'-triphosphate,3'-diphosphate pyrophosphatase [Kytococcus aerolatus]
MSGGAGRLPGARRVAAVDCGTNSIRLLVLELAPGSDGELVPGEQLHRENRIVRLGQGVDATGRIAPEAMERTVAAAADYAAICRTHAVEAVRFVATSASRDAENSGEFTERVREAFAPHGFDVRPEVISGDEEAALSFLGATGPLRASGVEGPLLVVDLGGGSTEFVLGTETVTAARSVDMGSVRITERFLASDPPCEDEIAAAAAEITRGIDEAAQAVDLSAVRALVGVAGTITTTTAHALDLPTYDRARIHGVRLPVEQAVEAAADLLARSRAERGELPYLHPGRIDVIGAGALVWRMVVERVAAESGLTEVVVSESDILDGTALDLARRLS